MRRIGIILGFCALWATDGFAVSRTLSTPASARAGTTTQRVKTQTTTAPRKTVRVTTPKTKAVSRSAVNQTKSSRSVANRTTNARSAVIARATTTETRTGTEYEQCKSAYFACMDQFCQLKNDEYRRCSCNDRILSLQSARDKLQQASEQLTAFNENLDIVGKTAAQAAAMNSASDGELALTKDNSASKALLTAIMNSIRGSDSRVENNKLSSLNSVDLSFDTANSLGTMDVGQTIASYNGQALYSAVYPQCRTAVKSSCNDASLQRAVNAYLMAIEQDCNTVQTAIENKQKETHAAIRESSSMLDMARAENHKAHNSDDAATCLANVEAAILSEEVCGKNYHKCLDNGEYIDVTTGAPIAGVVDFYKLGTLLTFNSERNNEDQRLAQNSKNRMFVTNFEKRVKQFAEPALDKCVDDADTVWTDYLNKAMLDIYYAQQSKVNEIKQGCFDFVSACYMNSDTAMTNAMQGLIAAQTTTLNPNVITLNKSLCSDYIASCNNMFDGNIVNEYIDKRQNTDVLSACRAVAKQCFDNYGGTNYENFYYPSSGLFSQGYAPDWFSLYDCTGNDPCNKDHNNGYKSECAKQLAAIDSCSNPDMIEEAFGGFDYYNDASTTIYDRYAYQRVSTQPAQKRLLRSTGVATEIYNQIIDILQTQCSTLNGKFMNVQNLDLYSNNYSSTNFCTATFSNSNSDYNAFYKAYSIGKTPQTCTYTLTSSLVGRRENNNWTSPIQSHAPQNDPAASEVLFPIFGGGSGSTTCSTENEIYENMCPRNYQNNVDTSSWGACLCWENGARRSNNGTSSRCMASLPVRPLTVYDINIVVDDNNNPTSYTSKQYQLHGLNYSCTASFATSQPDPDNNYELTYGSFEKWPVMVESSSDIPTEQDWCDATNNVNTNNQICPFGVDDNNGECNDCADGWSIPQGTTHKCCPNDYFINGDNCCPNGYEALRSSCYKCPDNYVLMLLGSGYGCCPLADSNNHQFNHAAYYMFDPNIGTINHTIPTECKYIGTSTSIIPTTPETISATEAVNTASYMLSSDKFPQSQ